MGSGFPKTGLGVPKPPFGSAQNIEKADVFGQIWLHVAICSLLTTSPCYLPPFFGKTLKTPTFMRFFPWLKLIKTSPCPPETSGFTHFFGGPSAGRADLHFSYFSVPLFEIEMIVISLDFSIFCASWKRPFQEPRRFFKFGLGSWGGAFHDVRLPTNADGNTSFLNTSCLNVLR